MASGPVMEDMECTERCRSVQHGSQICGIATQGTDTEVLSLWKSTCLKFHKIKDEFGRSAIHIAASSGRPKVVEWLAKREGCDVNLKDSSGYTPLHRSIYFGHIDCARTLIRLDASLTISDNEGYFPLDLIQLDSPQRLSPEEMTRGLNEVYVWGSNENYNLGTGSEQPKMVPEMLDKSKKLPWGHIGSCFIQVAFERYHTLFLHWSKDVYSCGYGVGGRLGLGNEFTAFTPTKVELGKDVQCIKVAVGPDHSLFLLSNGAVKSCGSNENFVLGHSHAMNKVFQPKHVDISAQIIDIAASRLHSAFLSEDDIYVCGVNAGQMLKNDGVDKLVKATKVNFPFEIEKTQRSGHKHKFTHVACTDSSTAIAHSGGNIFVLKNYECITLNARHVDIQKIQLVGGYVLSGAKEKSIHSDSEVMNQSATKLAMLVLIKTGKLLIWREGSEQATTAASKMQNKPSTPAHFNLAVCNIGRAMTIKDFTANLNSIVLINHTGEGFKANWSAGSTPICFPSINSSGSKSSKSVNEWSYVIQQSARHSTGKDPFSNMMLEPIKAKRISNIYKGIAAYSDPRGNNFAITQRHQKADQILIPMAMDVEITADFRTLLNEASCEDNIHDIVFQVRKSLFPAHRFIVASRCKNLYDQILKEIKSGSERAPRIVVKDVEPRVFEQILQYLYTNNCDMITSGKFFYAPDDPDWLELLKVYARKIGLNDLQKRLKAVYFEDGVNHCSIGRSGSIRFSWNAFPELYDVELTSDDGVQIKAHLCVLVARLEYFKSMLLSNFWLEGTKAQKNLRFPSSKVVMDIFIKLIYEGKVTYDNSGTKKDLEVLSQALIATDLLLSHQYRSEIECLLADCINVETVSEIIQLADVCNAPQIKESCMEFIAINLAALLENRYMDSIPVEMMGDLSRYYRNEYAHLGSRRIKDRSCPPASVYEAAEEKYRELFEDLGNIEELDYLLPRKSQQSKGKVKLPLRNRNLSTCSNQENEASNLSISLDEDDYYISDLPSPRQEEKFIPVYKQKHSPPPSSKEANNSIIVPTPTKIKIPLPSKAPLPQTPEEKPTPLTHRQAPAAPQNVRPLKMSDFPSFDDVNKKKSCWDMESVGNIENSPPRLVKPASGSKPLGASPVAGKEASSPGTSNNTQPPTASSRKKTKWVSLNNASGSKSDTGANSSSPPTHPDAASSGRDPKNPWQKGKSPSTNGVASNGQLNFDEILQQEERKKDNLRKALDKPLHLSQIEDQAIDELLKRYTSQDVIDGFETLSVTLVTSTNEYAIPVWRKVNDNPLE